MISHATKKLPAKLSLDELRALIGQGEAPLGRENFACSLVPGGIPRGALIEVTGKARTEWVVQALVENPGERVLWLEENFSILPTALSQRQLTLDRVLFVETSEHQDWTLGTVLRSQLFSLVVAPGNIHNEKILRRYQLLAEKAPASLFLLSERPSSAWAISLQVEAERDATGETLRSRLLKQKR